MRRFIWFSATLCALRLATNGPAAFPSTNSSYSNPILPGDFPDPSAILVGAEFWATATTAEWAPLFPLLRSRDLLRWEHVGNVFRKRPAWAVGSFWAPEISEYDGKFYLYYVGRKRGGPLSIAVATAPHPDGPWTDHGPLVSQPLGSIDPVTAIDENGDRFLVWKEDGNSQKKPTPIWAQKLSSDGFRVEGEMKELLRNDAPWEGGVIEGPFVRKHGDYFYLFYSGNGCCGRACAYAVGVARSKNLLGPWEKNPANPILAENATWKCPGHGSIVTTPRGRDFLIYHAYNSKQSVCVGRQGMMDEVKWATNGWPVINEGHGPSSSAPAPFGRPARQELSRGFYDDFDSAALAPRWQWPQDNEPMTILDHGYLILSPRPEHAADSLGATVGLPMVSADYTATTRILISDLPAGASAGLSAFGDRQNALGISVGGTNVMVWRRRQNRQETLARASLPATNAVLLRLTAQEGHRFQPSVSSDGHDWIAVGGEVDLEGGSLPPWDRSVHVSLVTGGNEKVAAKFDWIRVVHQQRR